MGRVAPVGDLERDIYRERDETPASAPLAAAAAAAVAAVAARLP